MRRRSIPAAWALLLCVPVLCLAATAAAQVASSQPTSQPTSGPAVAPGDLLKAIEKATPSGAQGGEWSSPIRLAVVFTAMALLPSLLVMMTSFTRIVIVLAFIRRALTTQSIPPTIAIVGLALFLTLFTMGSTIGRINDTALQPYLQDRISFPEACERGNVAIKQFMIRQTREDDLALFVKESGAARPAALEDLPSHVVVPAFAISEFRTAFEIGCLIFIPFLLGGPVISGILLSAGMMMLPPSMISLPFKIILFVLVDGWRLISSSLISGFR